MLAKVAFALLSVASSVLAHGNLQEIVVENPPATYIPWLPFQDPYKTPSPDRVGRKIPDNGPVEDVTSIDIQCNKGAVPAALIATAAAGSNVALNWTDWPTSHIGPVITYLAKAPSDITKWSPGTDKVWFKIDEAGLDNGKWAGTDVLLSQNGLWTVKIPQNLQPGQYLMRHEIIALHGAQNYPGAQFYPSCIQFEITGIINPYAGATTYPIPGPPVWNGAGSGTGNGGSGSPASSVAAPSSTAAASSTQAASSVVLHPPHAPVETEPSASAPAVTSTDAAPSASSSTVAPVSSQAPAPSSAAAPSTTAAPSTPTGGAGALAALYAQCGGNNYNGPRTAFLLMFARSGTLTIPSVSRPS
ncbi:Glycoside hydrolase [Rhizoctonia solani]|uniref:lytic cellulose monooxygenase (C4-dehydrogenating) n=1 Tax=Rhizoctonia solani TaxID=456999 RepID=A0A8H7IKR7_9AGAM|nr:Glycoside hydrolase [Rhizoctonia solani]